MMCSEYQIKTSPKEIVRALGTLFKNHAGEISWDATIRFGATAPVVRMTDDGPEIVERIFPVNPFPNARLSGFSNQLEDKEAEIDEVDKQIRRIYEVPRWKKNFAALPYLIPMTSFTEYAYWGEEAGSALAFKVPDQDVFFAAAIAMKPFVPKTGKEDAFSILTHTATRQMLNYHQRLIVLLKPESALAYLDDMIPEERFDFLIRQRYTGHLDVQKTRTMAKGWEKRAPVQNKKLEREKFYRSTLQSEHVEG